MKALNMDLTYQEAQDHLNGLVQAIESGELSIEEMIDKYEEGMVYYNFLLKKLEDMEQRISVLEQGEEVPYEKAKEE